MKTAPLKAFAAAALCCAMSAGSAAASVNQHELEMMETAKSVEIASQKIAKSYFYKHLDIRADHAGKDLEDTVAQLRKDILTLHEGIKGGDKEEKNIAVFLSYTRDELDKALTKPYSPEVGALMIDFSESLLEGADFLSGRYGKGKTGEAAMLAEAERLTFLLERVNKYYIIHKAGFKDYNNIVQLEKAVQDFEASLAKVNAYGSYPDQVKENVAKINQFWPVAKEFYLGVQQNALPVIVLASTDKLEKEVDALRTYHQSQID
ncbi:MAG: hypothetical protein ACTFAL_05370 [Candidatus Electronema sp. V4]|uniref:hypothetical protein n=1 Tax=Candidatus Electronema sp. V4 TaxID=3454756 RepID=UPI0040556B39